MFFFVVVVVDMEDTCARVTFLDMSLSSP